jgi:ubiquitin-protein ligase
MSPRDRRLLNDNKELRFLVSEVDSPIRIKSEGGIPPDKYIIAFHLKGLQLDPQDKVVERDYHEMEIYLPLEYPREKPQLKMLTPVFHPNIGSDRVCQSDNDAVDERLEDLVVRVAQMISYQAFNLNSPLDGKAAEWTEKSLSAGLFPVDCRDFFPASNSFSSRVEELPPISLGTEDDLGIRILGDWEEATSDQDQPEIRILGDWEKIEGGSSSRKPKPKSLPK